MIISLSPTFFKPEMLLKNNLNGKIPAYDLIKQSKNP